MKQITDDTISELVAKCRKAGMSVENTCLAAISHFYRINGITGEAQPAADDKAGGEPVTGRDLFVAWWDGYGMQPGVECSLPVWKYQETAIQSAWNHVATRYYTNPQPQAEAVYPDKAQNFYLAVCNFLVWIGREGIVHADDPIIDQLSNALHDIDGGVFKDSLKWPQAEVRAPDGYVLVPVEPTDDMLHCAQDRVYSLFLVDARNIWDAMLSAAPKPQDDLPAILKKQAS